MANVASDGSKWTNARDMHRQNRKLEARKPQPQAQADGGEMGEPEDGAEIAAQHGPATEVHMTHDHENGVHEVQSMHPDGHTHMSTHGSAEEAHEHGKKLAGGAHDEENLGELRNSFDKYLDEESREA